MQRTKTTRESPNEARQSATKKQKSQYEIVYSMYISDSWRKATFPVWVLQKRILTQ